MRATVCLPTYNELENLEAMVRALRPVLREGDRVLVVDDASPDGTGALADRLAAELPFVSVLHRPGKEGLGPAYIAGFRRALADGAELVLETIDLDAIRARGYAFQIETTYRVVRAGFRVVEVPISFSDREHGHSKMSRAIVAEAIWQVPLLRLRALAGRL